MSLSIHIATNSVKPFGQNYLIAKLAHYWQQDGHKISYGPVDSLDADLGILHFDQTRIPMDMVPENPCQCPFLNGNVLDISKSSFSSLRLLPDGIWDGPVIIKSDLNCFGAKEWKKKKNVFFERLRRRLAKKSWRFARRLPPKRYPVLNSLKDVPGWAWDDSEIIVERFIPEREQGLYCLRGWMFFGSRGYTFKVYSDDPMVKIRSMVKFEILDEPPAELVDFRMKNGFDFGKFDYVEIDNKPILLDINKTPTVIANASQSRMQYLAAGIKDFLVT